MLARDLLRRRVALALLVGLPLAFYGVTRSSSDDLALTSGGVGLAWSIAGAALFCSLAARDVDQRLVLDGFRPWELITGRLVMLTAFAAALAIGFGGLMVSVSDPPDRFGVVLALALVVAGGVPFGLAIGAIVPRELEGTLLLIGVVGIQMSVSSTDDLVGALPFGAAQRLLDQPARVPVGRGAALVHGAGWAVVLLAIVVVAWRRRVLVDLRPRRRAVALLVGGSAAAAVIALALPWPAGSVTDSAIVASISVGRSPFVVAAGPSGVWVSNYDDGTVSRVDPATDSVVAIVTVGHRPVGVIEAFGKVWVTSSQDGTLSSIDPSDDKVVDSVVVGSEPYQTVSLDGNLWVVDHGDNDVVRVDPVRRQVSARMRVGSHPNAIFAAAGSLWIANTGDSTLSRVDPVTDTTVATIVLPDPPQSIAGTDRLIVVTTGDRKTLEFIDPATNSVSRVQSYPQAQFVLDEATAADGTTWVAMPPSMLVRVASNGADSILQLGDTAPAAVAATNEAIWITDVRHQRLVRVDPARTPG